MKKKAKELLRNLKWEDYVIIIIGILLFGYVVVRAYKLSFVHDESYNYLNHASMTFFDIVKYNGPCPGNSHLLGTILQKFIGFFFDNKEWALRSPNIVAFVIYLISIFLIIGRFKKPVIKIFCFIVIVINPFVLDFFSLTRGYGLGLGFMMFSLYILINNTFRNGLFLTKRDTFLCTFFAALSVFSNFIFINYYISIVLLILFIDIFLIINGKSFLKLNFKWFGFQVLKRNKFILINTFILLLIIIPIYFKLKMHNQFYYGGTRNFFDDTLESLIIASLYGKNYFHNMVLFFKGTILILFIFCLFYFSKRLFTRKFDKSVFLGATSTYLISLIIIFVILQHILLDTKYLLERMGIYFIPLFSLAIVALIKSIVDSKRKIFSNITSIIFVTISSLSSLHFLNTANFTYTLTWQYDADTKNLIRDIIEIWKENPDHGSITLAIHWTFHPSILFYIEKYNLQFLGVDPRGLEKDEVFDLYYVSPEQENDIYGKNVEDVKTYSTTGNILKKDMESTLSTNMLDKK